MKPLSIILHFALVLAPLPDNVKPAGIPQLPKNSNWGQVTQAGNTVTIHGNEAWIASGEFTKDGTLILLWIHTPDGQPAPSIYRHDGKQFTGHWGWATQSHIEDGELVGTMRITTEITEPRPPPVWLPIGAPFRFDDLEGPEVDRTPPPGTFAPEW